ncbi:hypothetical protein GLOTRDRAFT_110023 [Gloeophyllum trabeum ATCC 11539]|uniref:Uncharacterized protein n=1 Tax=Gloeophyllum trabeum (strain ATCC 11539 / FP-39264 / Madison 617) TaxID=670483 RepID=S7QG04_GLOTA|nr:uncharacterized protein GLOTRDRAFT_110023 [Gloeophyllum trabeum ATCC 11539]EPQ58088.1 hypothetical protein GLOTRDRAFT_110023 [Gloeophyllum trabeum ATCC 11539]
MLQARYRNSNWNWAQGLNNNIDKPPSYPCWGSGHAAATVRTGDRDKNRAGLSDSLLFSSAAREDIVASAEVETWWTHPITWRDIFLARDNESAIYPMEEGVDNFETALVKQLWGRLVKHNIKFTAWMNLEVVIVALRLSNHEMAISNAMEWDSPELHETLCGFQLAALDQRKWVELNGVDLIQQLCPNDERKYGPRYGFPAVLRFLEHVENDDPDPGAEQAMADGDAEGQAQFNRDDAEDEDYEASD